MGSPARYYSSTAIRTTLTASIGSGDVSLNVSSESGFPASYPYILVIEKDTANEEIVQVTAKVGAALSVTRGLDGTTARSHSAGVSVEHAIIADDLTDFRAHEAAASNVHDIGATADVVGTTTTQTLTNKTLTSPTINGGTVNATTLQQGGVPAVTTTGAQTLTNKILTNPTINNGLITGVSLTAPTIGDFTNAGHDHSTASKGGNIPQSSVTNLVSDLALKESVANVTAHTSATVAHGATGAVVGTTNTQTLTNKTLTSPTINAATVTGAVTATGSTVTGGTLSGQTITGATLGGNLAAGNNKVTGLAAPTAASDAATKDYVDSTTVASAGDTMSGALNMGSNKVTNLGAPTVSTDAATKGYVDTSVSNLVAAAPAALDTLNELASALGNDANFSTSVATSIGQRVAKAGDSMTGDLTMSSGATVKGVPSPSAGSDVANKTYTDSKVAKAGDSVTGNLTFSGGAKVTGLPTPTASADAVNLDYVTTLYGSTAAAATSAANAASSASAASTSASNAATSATASANSATASATSATNSANSATASAGSATQASNSASNAATSATNAANSATAASASETAASGSATAASGSASAASGSASSASTSATNAANSATLASEWATKTTGPVAGGEYSAKYWAQIANTSNAVSANLVDAKGDLLVGSQDNTVIRVGVGSNDQVLMADSATASGVKWAAVEAAGAVAAHEADTTNVHGIANTADLATKSYADTAAANAAAGVVNAAPAALDTLNELAAALGNDASFSTTTATALGNRVRVDAAQSFNGTQQAQARSNIGAAAATHASTHGSAGSDPITIAQSQVSNLSTDLSLKAPLASPTLTGTPSAPTASVGTDTTQIATTAFVNAEISNDAVLKSLADAKGDIFVATADNTVTRLAVGADATVLTADATTGTGVKWATVSVPDSGFNSFLLMGA